MEQISSEYFLRIDGVRGESMDERHKEEIEVQSFSFAERQAPTSYGSSGDSSSPADMQDFTIVVRTSVASPLLFQACASGKHFKSARFSISDGEIDWMTFTLNDVVISSFDISGDRAIGTWPTERLSLSFSKISMHYTQRKVSGKGQKAGEAVGGWDLAANKIG
jgi:type VI secretion system secreted protein Hcp